MMCYRRKEVLNGRSIELDNDRELEGESGPLTGNDIMQGFCFLVTGIAMTGG